ncbi:MAG: hypothetical protein IKK77_00580 [Clostridia bacterium]|nr:hypothetical protein [Clostridia bacterium]
MILLNRRRALLSLGESITPNLPSDYQQVEYIEGTTGQFIATGVKIGTLSSPEVEVTMKSTGKYQGADVYALNGIYLGMPNIFQVGLALTSETTCRVTMNIGSGAIGVTDLDSSKFYTLYAKNGSQRVNGVEIGKANYAYNESDNVFYLFGRRDGNIIQSYNMQISKCKILDNGNLIRDYIPCYRKSDNVIGLYDLVENRFYTNQGTGIFVVGGDV